MPFTLVEQALDGLIVLQAEAITDERGFFMESWRADWFERMGIDAKFLQANHSRSRRGVVRGLHFQWTPPVAKLIRVSRGRAWLVAVDIRPGSPTLGRWHAVEATEDNRLQVYAPPGFARGFCALSEGVEVQYQCTAVYNPAGESGILWNDPELGIPWPVERTLLSPKDAQAPRLSQWLARPEAEAFRWLPQKERQHA